MTKWITGQNDKLQAFHIHFSSKIKINLLMFSVYTDNNSAHVTA